MTEVAPLGITTTVVEPGAFRTKPPQDRGRTVLPGIAVEGIVAKGRRLIADATALPELSTALAHDDQPREEGFR